MIRPAVGEPQDSRRALWKVLALSGSRALSETDPLVLNAGIFAGELGDWRPCLGQVMSDGRSATREWKDAEEAGVPGVFLFGE